MQRDYILMKVGWHVRALKYWKKNVVEIPRSAASANQNETQKFQGRPLFCVKKMYVAANRYIREQM